MNVLLIEDEAPAARHLARLLIKLEPTIAIQAKLHSIAASVAYLQQHPHPDLLFCDIQLSDGLSFEIFQRVTVSQPVIFTTAYDEYAVRAFEVNSIDYLLKPVNEENLKRSLTKYHQLQPKLRTSSTQKWQSSVESVLRDLSQTERPFRSRFLINFREKLLIIPIEEAAYFYSEQKISHLVTQAGKIYPLELTLEELDNQLNPLYFFRVNRQVIVGVASIGHIFNHFNGRLKLQLLPAYAGEVMISRERVTAFKEWLDQ